MKIALNCESVFLLKELAQKLPYVADDINRSATRLLRTYYFLEDELGVHAQVFKKMIVNVISNRLDSDVSELLKNVSNEIEKTVWKIERYLNTEPTSVKEK